MGYLRTIANMLKDEKVRHDIVDYGRAILIIAAVSALIRIIIDMLR